MLYAIYAYEETYAGLHGMNTTAICECDSLREAEEIGLQLGIEVQEDYDDIMQSIYDDAECEYPEGSEEYFDCIEELKAERALMDIYLITDTHGKTEKELEEEFYNDREGFVKAYCG